MQKKPKSINALMGYMRDVKGINIKGSNDKKKLRYKRIYINANNI